MIRFCKKLSVPLLLAGACLLASSARAEAATDNSARATFHRMLATYRALQSFSCAVTGEVKTAKETRTNRGQFAYRKPRHVIYTDEGGAFEISDGKDAYIYWPHANKNRYWKFALPGPEYGEAALMQQKPGGSFFAPILLGLNPYAAPWGRAHKSISRGAPQTFDGVAVEIVTIERDDGQTRIHYAIGRNDHLLRRIVYDWRGKNSTVLVTQTFTDIKANPVLPDATFVFTPPLGTTEENMQNSEQARWNDRLKIGAPPIAFSARDFKGQLVSLDDYKGKVLLLDFWATWCGPCVEELPHLKAAYKKYRAQGFEIVGISFDMKRAELEAFVKKHNMPWRQIFHDKNWKQPINLEYKVNSIPMTILIGRDGNIAAIGERALTLDQAIRTALAK